jgi:hypothetical protein
MARAIALDDAELVLDLSDVQFMSVSTLGVIVRARDFLRLRSRSLTVRSPSACARRILEVGGFSDLIGPRAEQAGRATGNAVGSWVAVPAGPRADAGNEASAPRNEAGTERVSQVMAATAQATNTDRRLEDIA